MRWQAIVPDGEINVTRQETPIIFSVLARCQPLTSKPSPTIASIQNR